MCKKVKWISHWEYAPLPVHTCSPHSTSSWRPRQSLLDPQSVWTTPASTHVSMAADSLCQDTASNLSHLLYLYTVTLIEKSTVHGKIISELRSRYDIWTYIFNSMTFVVSILISLMALTCIFTEMVPNIKRLIIVHAIFLVNESDFPCIEKSNWYKITMKIMWHLNNLTSCMSFSREITKKGNTIPSSLL